MSLKFSLKENKEKQIHVSYAIGKLEIKGHFHLSGNQPIGVEGGVPNWVNDVFENNLNVDQIAMSGEGRSIVFSRIDKY